MAKGKRGLKLTIHKLESLAKAVEELVPISNTEWERVLDMHMACYHEQNWTTECLKCKFQEVVRANIKTGNPNMLPHICDAKRAYYKIVERTDGSMGGGSDDSIFRARSDNSNCDEEDSEYGGEGGGVGGKGDDSKDGGGETPQHWS
jgi:hypothetical protein